MIATAPTQQVVGDVLAELQGKKPKVRRKIVADAAFDLCPQALEEIAAHIAIYWHPKEDGTQEPSLVLALLLTSDMPINRVAELFDGHDAYLGAPSDEIVALCPKTDKVRARIFDLGAELLENPDRRARDFGAHLLINICSDPLDWSHLRDTLLVSFDDLRKNVVEHIIRVCPPDQLASFMGRFAPECFQRIEKRATQHPSHHVAWMHWILDGLRKCRDTDIIRIVVEMFDELMFVPGHIRSKLNSLKRDFGLVSTAIDAS